MKETAQNFRPTVIILIIANILLFLLPSFWGSLKNILWGASLGGYLSKPSFAVQFFLLISAFLLLFLKIDLTAKISTPKFNLVWEILFCTLCALLQEASLLYGDALLLVKKIEVALPKFPTETLSILLYRTFYLLLPTSIRSGVMVYRIVNTAAVIPAAFCYLKLVQREGKSIQPAFLLILSSLGINALFMGHVENYTLVYVAMLAYFVLITDSNPTSNFVFLFFSLSICLHIVAILLLPSLIFYILKNQKQFRTWEGFIFLAIPFIGVIFLALFNGLTFNLLLKGVIEVSQKFFKLRATSSYFSAIFSLDHIVDVLNLLLLNMPILPLMVLHIIFGFLPLTKEEKEQNKIFLFLSIPFLFFIILFDSPLGLARDWDLGSLCLIVPILSIIIRFFKLQMLRKNFFLVVAIISILLSIPWFLVNHSLTLSIERFKDILEARPNLSGTAYGYEALGRHYWDKNDFATAAIYYQKAAHSSPNNWRFWTCAGLAYLYNNDLPNAVINLRHARLLFQGDPRIFAGLGTVYGLLGMKDSAKIAWEKAYSLDSTDITIQMNLAYLNYYDGNYHKTISLCQRVINQQRLYDAYLLLFDAYYATTDLSKAREVLEDACYQFGVTADILKREQLLKDTVKFFR
ncbi:MAG: hypothetical protein ABIL46_09380 [candidate division WOR-3 bacterium]